MACLCGPNCFPTWDAPPPETQHCVKDALQEESHAGSVVNGSPLEVRDCEVTNEHSQVLQDLVPC